MKKWTVEVQEGNIVIKGGRVSYWVTWFEIWKGSIIPSYYQGEGKWVEDVIGEVFKDYREGRM